MNRDELELQADSARMRGWNWSEQSLPDVVQQFRLCQTHEAGSVLRASQSQRK